jgi:hypothetical protein
MCLQPQDNMYKEFSDADEWGTFWLLATISESILNTLEKVATAAASACEAGVSRPSSVSVHMRHRVGVH